MKAKFDLIIEELCKKYREKENVIGIVLFGSNVKGNIHNYSDIDLFIIGEGEEHRTECYYLNDVPVQIIWRSPDVFSEKIIKRTRTLPISISCIILYDKTGFIDEYVNKAKLVSQNGPVKLTNQERLMMHAEVSMEYNTLKGLFESGEIASSLIMLSDLVLKCINLYYDNKSLYLVSNKHLISDFKKYNKELGALAETIVIENSIEKKFNNFEILREKILEILGGELKAYELMW